MRLATGENRLMAEGYNDDIVRCFQECYEEFKDQPNFIPCNDGYEGVYLLDLIRNNGYDIDGKCQSIFAYLADNVNYLLDPGDNQFIKSPSRLLMDRNGDCKSLTMFLVSCLHCLGISHKVRFVSFDKWNNCYSHVYAVAIDEQGDEIILDACELDPSGRELYDYARPYTSKKDLIYYE